MRIKIALQPKEIQQCKQKKNALLNLSTAPKGVYANSCLFRTLSENFF